MNPAAAVEALKAVHVSESWGTPGYPNYIAEWRCVACSTCWPCETRRILDTVEANDER